MLCTEVARLGCVQGEGRFECTMQRRQPIEHAVQEHIRPRMSARKWKKGTSLSTRHASWATTAPTRQAAGAMAEGI